MPAAAETSTNAFWRGHLFLFERLQPAAYSTAAAYKLLLVFLIFEALLRPFSNAGARLLGITDSVWWPLLQISALIALACWLVVKFVRMRLSQLGLARWRGWSKVEKVYFLEIVPIAVIIFCIFVWNDLRLLWTRPDLWRAGLLIFLSKMIWGFYQEFLYRGMLQAVLVRGWGTYTGILVSNLVFTFGPLHFYHFATARANPSHLWIFAGIFAIGLFFAVLFHRSGNLWIVGTLHGVGDWFIDGLSLLSRMAR